MNATPLTFDDERPLSSLQDFGLSEEVIHQAFKSGWSRARRRSRLAAKGAGGSDIYHGATEELANLMTAYGWEVRSIRGQQRCIHPEGLMAISVASAKDVNSTDPRKRPHTREKGPSTLDSLDRPGVPGQQEFDLPGITEARSFEAILSEAPLWLLLHEEDGAEMKLALGRPSERDKSGRVIGFSRLLQIESLQIDQDLDVFRNDDESAIDFEIPRIR